MDCEVVALDEVDIGGAMALSTAAGWNQTEADWHLFLAHGSVWGLRCEGKLVASAAILPFGPDRAWLSMVLTLPGFRRRGFASRLVAHALAHACGIRGIWLDATPFGQPVYERLGFRPLWSFQRWRLPRHPGVHAGEGVVVREIGAGDWPTVFALDRRAFGAPRDVVLMDFARRSPAAASVALRGERVAGFVLARPGRIAPQIGPLVAEDETTALCLLSAALQGVKEAEAAVIDVPDRQQGFLARLADAPAAPVRAFRRMTREPDRPQQPPEGLFALAGPEFG